MPLSGASSVVRASRSDLLIGPWGLFMAPRMAASRLASGKVIDVVSVGGGVVVVGGVISVPSDNNTIPTLIPVIANTAMMIPTRSHFLGSFGGPSSASGEGGSTSVTNLAPQLAQKLASGGLSCLQFSHFTSALYS